MLKKSLGLVSGAALICLFAYGCSSDTTTNVNPTTEAGTAAPDSGKPKTDAVAPPDTDAEPTPLCAPSAEDVKDFTPTWKPPSGKAQKKCSDAQVEAIITCQLDDTADKTACKAIAADKNNKDCAGCLFSDTTVAKYGPLISGDGVIGVNYAGCIALLEPNLTDAGCGAKYQALGECSDTACQCPVTDDDTFAARNKCTAKADTTVCKAFAADAACDTDLVAPGAAAEACNISGGAFIDNAMKYGLFFCAGGGAGDGGTDSSTDAPKDG